MTVTTLRPNGVCTDYLADNVAASAGTDYGAASDQSDATWAWRSGGSSAYAMVHFELGTVAVPSTQILCGVSSGIRTMNPNHPVYYGHGVRKDGGGFQRIPIMMQAATNGSATSHDPGIDSGGLLQPHGVPWTQAAIDGLLLEIRDPAPTADPLRARIYEAWAKVYTLPRPTADVTAPTGTITSTVLPAVAVSVSNIVEAWQLQLGGGVDPALDTGQVQVRIFTNAQAVAGGFDPATTTPVWSSDLSYYLSYIDGVATSSHALADTCDVPLVNGTTYRCYARANVGDVATTDKWGSWDYTTFTLNLDVTSAPTTSATANAAAQKVALSATPIAKTGHTLASISFERSKDLGVTWEPVRSGTDIPSTFGLATMLDDYMGARGVALQYRARTLSTYGGGRVASAWATVTNVTVPATGWNLKVPQQPDMNVLDVRHVGDVPEEYVEDLVVQRPKGRSRPVVLAAAVSSLPEDGAIALLTAGTAEWAALKAVLKFQGPVFLETPYGEAKWIRITGRSVVLSGTAALPRRSVQTPYVEVDPAPEV